MRPASTRIAASARSSVLNRRSASVGSKAIAASGVLTGPAACASPTSHFLEPGELIGWDRLSVHIGSRLPELGVVLDRGVLPAKVEHGEAAVGPRVFIDGV